MATISVLAWFSDLSIEHVDSLQHDDCAFQKSHQLMAPRQEDNGVENSRKRRRGHKYRTSSANFLLPLQTQEQLVEDQRSRRQSRRKSRDIGERGKVVNDGVQLKRNHESGRGNVQGALQQSARQVSAGRDFHVPLSSGASIIHSSESAVGKGEFDEKVAHGKPRQIPGNGEATQYNDNGTYTIEHAVRNGKVRRSRQEQRDAGHGKESVVHANHDNEKEKEHRRISGPKLEAGTRSSSHTRGGAGSRDWKGRSWWKRKKWRIIIGIALCGLLLVIIIAVAVSVSKKKNMSDTVTDPSVTSTSKPSNNNLQGIQQSSIPGYAQGTYLDPFTWYDTIDFNVTFTNATVGGLSVMGLNSTWDDSTRANTDVPPLDQAWSYGTMKIRGMNIGGWLSIEPFITPSFFDSFPSSDGIIDEWTLTTKLGANASAQTLEQHYSAFVSEQTFADIQAAGFDHVRIPFSYWAVTTYPGDPYLPRTSWRYLLRAIEWARKRGLRINLDLHALPGSQNGWNHSGRQGAIGWLNGTDGQLNADRSLDLHRQLSTFFAQPRYANIVTMYGLANEPRMIALNQASVLNWTTEAVGIVRSSGMPNSTIVVIGDGFMGLVNWRGLLPGLSNVLLDAHQYVVFNADQSALSHSKKIDFACQGWSQQAQQSMSPSTGFGNFLCGEWSQADTDCVKYLNNVNAGSRWTGTLDTGNATTSVLEPVCPERNASCTCDGANAAASRYGDAYRRWLMMFAEAQMWSFEKGWGWFYWTWKTEGATQWSYESGMAAGILPTDVRAAERGFACDLDLIPDFGALGLSESY